MPLRICYSLLVLTLCCLLGSTAAFAQIEPDTVKRKRELPARPTVEPHQQKQPRVTPQPQTEVIQPQVVRPDQEEPEALIDRMFWGGSFGLQFGTYTNISLLPMVGYRATETFWLGIGGVYHYRSFRGERMHNYGGRVFAQQQVFENFLIHAEFEQLSVEVPLMNYTTGLYEFNRRFIGIPMAGLGYRQRIGERGAADILLLYNFNESYASPYSNPIIRAGFSFPFRKN